MDIILLFEKFGLPVAFLMVMIYLFTKSEEKSEIARKDHRAERTEWREGQEKLQTNTNEALKELTKVITKIEAKSD